MGRKQNAEPRWLIPMLCRHANLAKRDIGAIRMQPVETYVEIHADAGLALLDGTLVFAGEAHAVATLDLAQPKSSAAFVDHLHGFGWLRDLAETGDRARAVPAAGTSTGVSRVVVVLSPSWPAAL